MNGGGLEGNTSRFERRTGHRQCSKDDSLFRIGFVLIAAPFHKGWDSIGAYIPMLGNILLHRPWTDASFYPKIILQKKRPQ